MCFFFGNNDDATKKKQKSKKAARPGTSTNPRGMSETKTKTRAVTKTQHNAPTTISTVQPKTRAPADLQRTDPKTHGGESERTDVNGPKLDEGVARAMMDFVDETVAKGIGGLKKEYERIGQSKAQASRAFKDNALKNRYGNIPCFDFNRVVLSYQSPPESDYIHANRFESKITALNSTFICTQAPTERTINDFWRMVWQEKPKFIVMLCRLFENKKPKCSLYWPERKGERKTYGTVSVTNEGDGGKGNEPVFDIEKFRVEADDKEIIVKHIRWLDWPDFGIPKSGLGMLRVLRKIDMDKGTAIVHCSAGIGRTGTLMAAEITMKALTNGKHVKVPEVVQELRAQRHGMVQTSSQYIYLHFSIATYCERKLKDCADAGGQLIKLKEFFAAYKDFANNEEMEDRVRAQLGHDLRNTTNAPK